jgi:serine/threonine protein kinase
MQPATLPAEDRDPAPAWHCLHCNTVFRACFFCDDVWDRADAPERRCRNATCVAHGQAARPCPQCGAFSVIDPPNGLALCRNPRCTPFADTPWPVAVTPLPTTVPPPPGDPVGVEPLLRQIAAQSHFEERYRLHQQLFRGGMGQVWKATDRILGRDVAVKMMHAPERVGPAAWGQFLKEARVGGRLLHPNILPVFDLGVNRQGHIYFTMRLVRGASLWTTLDAVATGCATRLVDFPLPRVMRAFRDACLGVDFAHRHGVLHLDLKPNNLLVSDHNEVFVIDWGLARVDNVDDTDRLIDLYTGREADTASTYAGGGFVGTPAFMAPEQALGRLSEFGPATDVYGLGGVLFFILYAEPPNRSPGGGVTDTLEMLTRPQRPGRLRPGILPRGQRIPAEWREAVAELETVCARCLAREPAGRFGDVGDLLAELNAWLARPGLPV